MKPPEKIYLQCYDETGELLNLVHDDVTWCVDQINEGDAVYVLAQAQEENRVRGECLEIAMEALKKYGNMHHSYARRRLVEIECRLAQLEPEEETDPCEGCGNEGSAALFRTNPASGNALCVACEGYKEETGCQ